MDVQPQTMTQAEFARHLGRNRATITRAKAAGRLVLTDEGLVDVAASLARLQATAGSRPDLSDLWAERRRAQSERGADRMVEGADQAPTPPADHTPTLAPGDALDTDAIGRRTRFAQMLKAEAEAEVKRREAALARGDVVERAAVRKDLTDAVSVILNAAETLPDRLAPSLLDVGDLPTVQALLRDAVEQLLAQISTTLGGIAQPAQPAAHQGHHPQDAHHG